MSRALADDASAAYHRLRHNAQILGTISSSFAVLARSVTGAYFAALSAHDDAAWATLVSRTALLVRRATSIDGIVAFDAAEREALAFFAAIVSENADLLESSRGEAERLNREPVSA